MTILDANGNVLFRGRRAARWFARNKGSITKSIVDSVGRSVVDFSNGRCAMFFADREAINHPELVRDWQDIAQGYKEGASQ
jgi:hypothetical protein